MKLYLGSIREMTLAVVLLRGFRVIDEYDCPYICGV